MQALKLAGAAINGSPNLVAPLVGGAKRKKELGQFLTPPSIAAFMASLFKSVPAEVRLLDAGAGDGALTHALVNEICSRPHRPEKIAVSAYELDAAIIPRLEHTLARCRTECHQMKIEFRADSHNEDFIEAAASLVRRDLFGDSQTPFNAAILNPPYRKINSISHTRRLLRHAGIETSNLYTGFLALAAKLLEENGEMVAICPRSFCNGPYFRPFRQQFLQTISLRRLHVFESRSAAFERDDVLQENIILHAVKSRRKPESIIISISSGKSGSDIVERSCAYTDTVSPQDPDFFIHLVAADTDQDVRRTMSRFTTSLEDLELEVSTGRVVEFRAKQFILKQPTDASVPLIYPCHFDAGFISWPNHSGRKPNAIRDIERTQELLVANGTYVLTKRFTTKEERRRVVASIYDPQRVRAERVGFENHLNYFHAMGRGLSVDLAKGLAAYLNSTVVDLYFRQFNGHTQVNAADLRKLNYPSRNQLESLGRRIGHTFPDQAELDALIGREFN